MRMFRTHLCSTVLTVLVVGCGLTGGGAEASASPTSSTLTRITTGWHEKFDRVVLEFDGPAPVPSARYVDQIHQDACGTPIPVKGNAFLQVALQGATTHDDEGRAAFPTSRIVDTSTLTNIREVVFAGDFEAVVTLGIGVDNRADYQLFALSNPTRVVVDVGH